VITRSRALRAQRGSRHSATNFIASTSKPESFTKNAHLLARGIAICRISFSALFSPPEKPTVTDRFSISASIFQRLWHVGAHNLEELCRQTFLLASEPCACISQAVRRKVDVPTRDFQPDTGTRNRPAAARSSGSMSSRSSIAEMGGASVTSYRLCQTGNRTTGLPDPLGPMIRCTLPLLAISRSTPFRDLLVFVLPVLLRPLYAQHWEVPFLRLGVAMTVN